MVSYNQGLGENSLDHSRRGEFLAIFLKSEFDMRELSIFIDESGDFGVANKLPSYYISPPVTKITVP